MAVVNATPDSFSGDGIGNDVEAAIRYAVDAEAEGADLIDVGAESTRPRHIPVGPEEELRRLLPVIRAIAARVAVPISVDTSKAVVAEAALDAGASMVNDVRGLTRDPELARVVARRGVPVVLMHDLEPDAHVDLVTSIVRELSRRLDRAVAAGIAWEKLIVDPGFGFGKDWRQNLELLRRLGEFRVLGRPVLVGLSRKSTIGKVLGLAEPDRLEGTLATTALAIANGADIVRVHDVRANLRVARMTDAVVRGAPAEAKRWPGGPPP
jgi:dihydropteroate synthase